MMLSDWYNILIIAVFIVMFFYSITISLYSVGWYLGINDFIKHQKLFKGQTQSPSNGEKNRISDPAIFVSIIVAFRNEAENIFNLLKSIEEQSYPKHLFELILIDDHSEDTSTEVTEKFISAHKDIRISLIKLDDSEHSKKAAIVKGLKLAKGELILFTDADCVVNSLWMERMVDFFINETPDFIVAPVAFTPTKNLFVQWQHIEYASLIASAGGSLYWRMPLMCTAANMAIRKDSINFEEFDLNKHFASGDDMFMMLAMQRAKRRIRFLFDPKTIVFTNPILHLTEFFKQRKRWVSKTKANISFWISYNALTVYFANFLILVLAISSIFNAMFFYPSLLILGLKIFVDAIFFFSVLKFFGSLRLIWLLPFAEIVNVIYVNIIAIAGSFSKYVWKNRIISH